MNRHDAQTDHDDPVDEAQNAPVGRAVSHRAATSMRRRHRTHWLLDRCIRIVLGGALLLPYDTRRAIFGGAMAWVIGPLAGYRTRILANLRLIFPDMSAPARRKLARSVPGNVGKTLIEIYSGDEFVKRVADIPIKGEGLAALEQAHREGRPVILVTGHIGNYDAVRAALNARGYGVGGLYKPMSNPYFNEHYVKAISRIGTPMFERGRKGLTEMLRYLKGGGKVGIVLDQRMANSEALQFMGHPAQTSTQAAQLAIRYNATLIATYGIRRSDGGFDLIMEAPVVGDDPKVMTQALNDSLERQVRAHMDQWLWTHWRWGRQETQ